MVGTEIKARHGGANLGLAGEVTKVGSGATSEAQLGEAGEAHLGSRG